MTELQVKNVGPASKFEMEFGSRLNIFTGDNGLGKTFLLDTLWWGLTETWAEHPVRAYQRPGEQPEIRLKPGGCYRLSDRNEWKRAGRRTLHKDVVIYVRVDGSFAVYDPLKHREGNGERAASGAYRFTPDSLWNGLEEQGKVLCNGLIRDWITWQYHPKQQPLSPFNVLSQVLKQLSPSHKEQLKPGEPTRISIDDVRDIPTIDLPYGTVPVTLAAAGMKRILGLAYVLVWTWYEHRQAAKVLNRKTAQRIMLLIDEVEAHLHPQWQRSLLTSLVTVAGQLTPQMSTQLIVTTHSPLVLASVEPLFDEKQDKLFLFEQENTLVTLHEEPWAKQGDVVGWLTSDIFGLQQARSKEAELAIDAANTFMRGDALDNFPPSLQTKEGIHHELQRVLAGHDPFWPRWIVSTREGLS